MPMDRKAQEMSAEDQGADQAQMQGQAGGAAKLVADVHTGMMKLMDLVGSKYPEDASKLASLIQGYQAFVDGLGAPADAPAPEQAPAMPATTTTQAGAAQVKPVM